jgi:hypothetical protein
MDHAEAARRIARYESTLDPRDLWPDVSETQFLAAMSEVARVTSAQLADTRARASLSDPLPGGESGFAVAAFASGMGPLLGYWIETGRLEAPGPLIRRLQVHLEEGRKRAERLRAELTRILRVLADEGIDVVVLKGMHTGWTYFPDPGTRPCADLDVLIPRDRGPDVERVLAALGFTRPARDPRERTTWAPPAGPATASVDMTRADNPWTLDVHVTLDRNLTVTGPMASLGALEDADVEPWDVSGTRARVLAQPLLTGFLAVHVSHHFPMVSLVRLAELTLVIQRDLEWGSGWTRLFRRLGPHGALPFTYPGLAMAEKLVPGTVDPDALRELRNLAPPRVRHLVDRVTPATALQLYRRSMETRFLWVPTRRALLASFIAWLWPRELDGSRAPVRKALLITGRRLRRLLAGRMTWRQL